MGQNFDDYPDFQKIPGMPILLQHSVCQIRNLKNVLNGLKKAVIIKNLVSELSNLLKQLSTFFNAKCFF